MIWPHGKENWCNLKGKFIHIVADLSHLSSLTYEMSICYLGIYGTEYVRSETAPTQEITVIKDQTYQF